MVAGSLLSVACDAAASDRMFKPEAWPGEVVVVMMATHDEEGRAKCQSRKKSEVLSRLPSVLCAVLCCADVQLPCRRRGAKIASSACRAFHEDPNQP
ncbi:hypothetical protein L1887_51408 [Cichorium endivia]|nr:hypothetical protein L1887_51408 [Cichorium endivia]